MLIGASPFHGETATDSIGAVLHKDLDLDLLPPTSPVNARRVLNRCLERDKSKRYRDIGDVRIDLQAPPDEQESRDRGRTTIPWGIAAISAAIAIGAILLGITAPFSTHGLPEAQVIRFDFEVPWIDGSRTAAPQIATTADAGSIAVQADANGEDPIYIRRLDRNTLEKVETPWESEPTLIRWTRDSRWLIVLRGTVRDGELWKISPFGESPRLICALPDSGFLWGDSVEYLDHETLIVGLAGAGLWTVPERGGRMQQYLKPDSESETWVQPCVLPNTNALLFLEITGGTLEVIADGQRRTLYDFQRDRLGELNITADGSILVSVFAGSLSQGVYRLGFDPESLRVTSDPVLLYPLGDLDITDNGALIFAPRLIQDPVLRDLVWVNTDGSISEVIARGFYPMPVMLPSRPMAHEPQPPSSHRQASDRNKPSSTSASST